MALMQQPSLGSSALRAVGDGWLETQQQRWEASVMLTADSATDWPVSSLAQLRDEHFEVALATRPQVLLLATGARLRFPDAALLARLRAAGVGLEVMDHHAAARTFNLLLGEGRKVTALFLIEAAE